MIPPWHWHTSIWKFQGVGWGVIAKALCQCANKQKTFVLYALSLAQDWHKNFPVLCQRDENPLFLAL